MKRPASLAAGILFLLMAVAQLCRFVLGIEVTAARCCDSPLAQRSCRGSFSLAGLLAFERKK